MCVWKRQRREGDKRRGTGRGREEGADIPTAKQLWSWLKVTKLSAVFAMASALCRRVLPRDYNRYG